MPRGKNGSNNCALTKLNVQLLTVALTGTVTERTRRKYYALRSFPNLFVFLQHNVQTELGTHSTDVKYCSCIIYLVIIWVHPSVLPSDSCLACKLFVLVKIQVWKSVAQSTAYVGVYCY